MEQSTDDVPFYAAFGDFKEGYNRKEAEVGINNAFRAHQKERRERYLKELLLGSGIGHLAKQTVHDGLYQPQTSLHLPSNVTCATGGVPVAKENFEETGGSYDFTLKDVFHFGSFPPHDMALLDGSPSSVMERFAGGKAVEVHNMLEVQQQLCDNIKVAEECIARLCAPFVFDDILESLPIALRAIEEGDAQVSVLLPMQKDGSVPLEGGEPVMKYALENIMPFASTLVSSLYATEWMLQYTMTFANSLVAKDEDEAHIRLQILALCVRWLGRINRFFAFAVVLDLASKRYKLFVELRALSERHVKKNINKIEKSIKYLLLVPFFGRRKALSLRVEEISKRLQRVFAFLGDVETNWIPSVTYEVKWKNELFSWVFEKIHYEISPGYLLASFGFIDESLYTRLHNDNGALSLRNALRCASLYSSSASESKAKLSVATLVMIERVKNKSSFQQIGVAVKETASYVVGLQLCMGARYILRQCGEKHDVKWGFSMKHARQSLDVYNNTKNQVSRFTDAIRKETEELVNKDTEFVSSLPSLI